MSNKGYTFLWFIENCSYCWHKIGETLTSPVFTLKELRDTAWRLSLFPRGDEYDPDSPFIQLDRCGDDGGPNSLSLTYSLTIVSKDGSAHSSVQETASIFRKESDEHFTMLDMEIFSQKRDDYLPKDILTVRCRLSETKENADIVETICARTRLGVGCISFCRAVEGFSAIEPNQKKTYEIYSHVHKGYIKLCVYVSDCSCCEQKVIVEITLSDPQQILAKCELYLLDSSGKKIKCAEADNRFRSYKKEVQKLPLSLTKDAILKKKSEYLPDDKLSLLCECVFSTGIEFQKIEGVQNTLTSDFEKVVSFDSPVRCANIFSQKLSACPGAVEDLNGIFSENFLTDVVLKTKSNSFPAHKVVLCARSPVFKVMLSNDMKEKNSGSIQMDDLEDETVEHLLHFLYSDNLEELQWETAAKLYYVADKYEIEKLRLVCSSFLVGNLTAPTATELLELADTHSDNDLKKVVESFILEHDDEVFISNEWEELMKKNPQLAVKTMHLKYEIKKKVGK